MLMAVHGALRSTRGAAVSIAEVNEVGKEIRFAGVGNVSCTVSSTEKNHSLAPYAGIVGHEIRRVQHVTSPWNAAAVLIMFSDGIATRWRLDQYPDLRSRHPSVIAGVIYRDHARGRDDATVVVARSNRPRAGNTAT
jgi:hypothetical protein